MTWRTNSASQSQFDALDRKMTKKILAPKRGEDTFKQSRSSSSFRPHLLHPPSLPFCNSLPSYISSSLQVYASAAPKTKYLGAAASSIHEYPERHGGDFSLRSDDGGKRSGLMRRNVKNGIR